MQLATEVPGIGDNVNQDLGQADTSQDSMLDNSVEIIQEVAIEEEAEEDSESSDQKPENDQGEFEKSEKIKINKNI